jgi:hypothetical protein
MADLLQYLQQAGFKGEALRTAWAIAKRESGGRPDAYNPNRATGDDSYGLFQINMLGSMGPARRKQFGIQDNKALLDPAVNARAAYQMSKGGTDFGAWGIGPNAYRKMPALNFAGYPGPEARAMSAQAAQNISVQSSAPVDPRAVGNYAGAAGQLAENQDQIIKTSRLNRLLAQAAPSEATQSILGRLGGIAGRTAQHLAASPIQNAVPEPIYKGMTPQTGTPVAAAPASKGDYQGKVLVPTIGTGTHVTDGLDWNHGDKTARDIMAKPGTPIGAPEDGQIVRWGSAQGGEAMYFKGSSGRMYWLGHIDDRLPVGTNVKAGQAMAVVSSKHKAPHLHFDYKE